MWKIINISFIFLLVFLFNSEILAQITKGKKIKSEKSATTIYQSKIGLSNESKKSQEKEGDSTKQSQFRSPFRYIIFSNLTEKDLELTIPQRRLEILMDKKAFNVKNLKLLVELLKERFPLPIRLKIKIHTSLATIETLEEKEMVSDHTSRENYENYYKTALYIRDSDGDEGLSYAVGSPPGFWWRRIVLSNAKQPK